MKVIKFPPPAMSDNFDRHRRTALRSGERNHGPERESEHSHENDRRYHGATDQNKGMSGTERAVVSPMRAEGRPSGEPQDDHRDNDRDREKDPPKRCNVCPFGSMR